MLPGNGKESADPVPAHGAAVALGQGGKLPVFQHLGGQAAVDAVPGVLQIVTEIQGG